MEFPLRAEIVTNPDSAMAEALDGREYLVMKQIGEVALWRRYDLLRLDQRFDFVRILWFESSAFSPGIIVRSPTSRAAMDGSPALEATSAHEMGAHFSTMVDRPGYIAGLNWSIPIDTALIQGWSRTKTAAKVPTQYSRILPSGGQLAKMSGAGSIRSATGLSQG